MKEKVIILDSSVDITGALKSSLLLASALNDKFDLSFIFPYASKAGEKVKSSGYTVYYLPVFTLSKKVSSILLYFPMLFVCSLKLLKILKSEDVSVLILNDFDKPLGLFLNFFGWKGRIYTFVRRRPSSFNKWLSLFWIRTSLFTSRKVVAVSNAVLNELPRNEKVVRIYNAVDLCDKRVVTNYPCLDIVDFLCLGNYMPGKGQNEVLESFLLARKKYKNIRLHFAGGDLGLSKNLIFKESLMKKVSELGLDDVVSFEGHVDDVERVISNSHVVLNFSKSESFSRVCVEAASYGRPVVATMSGGPQEIISHGESGLLVEVDDIYSMAESIGWFANNSEKIPNMGKRAKEIVRTKFSFDNFKLEVNDLMLK